MIRKRSYTLGKRAENQAETRRRIVEATVDLHAERGPAHTSITAIAERAGVQRHTVYAHFPTERELGLACSGLALNAIRCRTSMPGGKSSPIPISGYDMASPRYTRGMPAMPSLPAVSCGTPKSIR